MKKKSSCCLVATVLFVVFGTLFFGSSWLSQLGFRQFLGSQIHEQIVFDSPNAPNYERWQKTYAPNAPRLYVAANFFNITNLDEVRKGALPIVEEVGPYVYWNKKDLIDIEWLEGGNQAKYNTMTRYIFVPEMSAGNAETDIIVQVNPAYPAALSQAGGELFLVVGLTGPSIKMFFDFMWDTWIPDLLVQTVPPVLSEKKKNLTDEDDPLAFYRIWANQTNLVSPEWMCMQVSLNQSKPSGISLSSAQQLFNASTTFSLLSTDDQSSNAWRQALEGNSNSSEKIRTTFELTEDQMSALLAWYRGVKNGLVVPYLLGQYNVSSIKDLLYLQWGMGTITKGVSVTTLYDTGFPSSAELGVYWFNNEAAMISAQASKKLLSGPMGIFSAQNLGLFLKTTANPFDYNETFVMEVWGINRGQVDGFFLYLLQWITYSRSILDDIVARGGGLFAARTVNEWLMENQDPLLVLLSPDQADSALIGNESTPEAARKKHGPNIVYTGKNDIKQVQEYLQWFGQSVVEDVYARPMPVHGVNDLGFFQPFLDLASDLWSWDSNYVRNMHLIPVDYIEHRGVIGIRYTLDHNTWDINATLYQSIKGFANLTNFHNGSSVMLSNPHMYLADPKYINLIQGKLKNDTLNITYVDAEPNSGNIIWYNESLQINIYLDPSKSYFNMYIYNPKVRLDVMYPIVYIHMYAELTESLANEVKDSLYLALKAEPILFWTILFAGSLLLMISIPSLYILFYCLSYERRQSPFEFSQNYESTYRLINSTDE